GAPAPILFLGVTSISVCRIRTTWMSRSIGCPYHRRQAWRTASVSEDSQHWYLPDGSPFFECKARDGHMRPVTLRDARKVHAVPSVTTVLSVVAKPNLEVWKVQQGILAALTLPRIPNESEADWLQRVRDDAKAQAKAAAEEGSRIHAALEAHARGQTYPQRYQPHVQAVWTE